MLKQTTLILTTLGLVAGCSTPDSVMSNGVNISYDAVYLGETPADTYVKNIKLEDATLDPGFVQGKLIGWKDVPKKAQGYFGNSTSGGSTAFVGGTNLADSSFLGVSFMRHVEAELPTQGNTTYTGGYAGIMRYQQDGLDASFINSALITGDTQITADFDTSEVVGTITNRHHRDPRDHSIMPRFVVSDVSLELTTLNSDGSYSGSATGGSYLRHIIVDPEVGGTFTGIIAGDSGQETVGGIFLPYLNTGSSYNQRRYFETGVFIAE